MAKHIYNKSTGRNYAGYDTAYESTDKAKKDRAARNKARREALRGGKATKGDGKDVHHRDGNPRNNKGSNKAVVSRSTNRGKK